MRGLEKRLGIERTDAVWAVAENWAADSEELEPSWRVQRDYNLFKLRKKLEIII